MTELSSRLDSSHLAVYLAMPEDLLDGLASDIPATRDRVAKLTTAKRYPEWPSGVVSEDHWVSEPNAPNILVRLYRVPSETAAPVLLWIHGGGFMFGSIAMSDFACAETSAQLGVVVASVEYRLAPEHPFPQPLEDCYAALLWLASSSGRLGIDTTRIAVGGASAGGGLAAGVTLLARDRGEVTVAFQLLVYPMLDDRPSNTYQGGFEDRRVWTREANAIGWNSYLSGRAGADDISPYAAPARATNLQGLPPTYISVGDLDGFVAEDLLFAQKLMSNGVPVELHVYPGAFHGSDQFVSRSELSKRWTCDERAALARALLEDSE